MKQITLLLFLHLSQGHRSLQKCDNKTLMKNEWEDKLHDKLMCNYHANTPPKPFNDLSDSIRVNPFFIVKNFKFLSEQQEFAVFTWTHISWRDERLEWNPDEYDGIQETVMEMMKIWAPGIKLYNSINDLYDQAYDPFMPCRITKSGGISCLSYIWFQAKCPVNLRDWPFDTQVCSLQFGPWATAGTRVRLYLGPFAMAFIGSEYGAEWDIIDYSQEEDQDAEIQIKFEITLVRHTENLAAIIIFPSILLSILTLCTLFLDVRCYTRVLLTSFSLMCHFYFLSELGMNIPKQSNSVPTILLYYRGSLIVTFISVILTFLMKFLFEREVAAPNFVVTLNEYLYTSYGKLVIRPRWEVTTDDDDKREIAKTWTDFVNILNCAWIYVTLTVYFVMCCVFIPSPSGLKNKIPAKSFDFM